MECYQYGNTVEEYCLPLISFCVVCFLVWIEKAEREEYEHSLVFSFIYGVSHVFCLWTRATNALPIIGGTLAIVITLVFRKLWKSLLCNILAAIIGVVFISFPIILFFIKYDGIDELWYGTVLFSLSYMSKSNMNIFEMPLSAFWRLILCYGNCVILFCMSIVMLFPKTTRIRGGIWGLSSLFTGLWLFRSNGYPHYGLIAAPFFFVIIGELVRCYYRSEKK